MEFSIRKIIKISTIARLKIYKVTLYECNKSCSNERTTATIVEKISTEIFEVEARAWQKGVVARVSVTDSL